MTSEQWDKFIANIIDPYPFTAIPDGTPEDLSASGRLDDLIRSGAWTRCRLCGKVFEAQQSAEEQEKQKFCTNCRHLSETAQWN